MVAVTVKRWGIVLDTRIRQALGFDTSHLVTLPHAGLLEPATAAALRRLNKRARAAGLSIDVASGHRDYVRQLAIFNAKFRGERRVTDDRGAVLVRSEHSDEAWLHRVLRFSALPGCSRHHWGTDVDVWDRSAVSADYRLALSPDEYRSGPFCALSEWLSERINADDAEGFYRPYAYDSGGVAPEPWHLSYRPSAQIFSGLVDRDLLLHCWRGHNNDMDAIRPLEGLSTIEPGIDRLLRRYVVD